jgi:hypothetical protein
MKPLSPIGDSTFAAQSVFAAVVRRALSGIPDNSAGAARS